MHSGNQTAELIAADVHPTLTLVGTGGDAMRLEVLFRIRSDHQAVPVLRDHETDAAWASYTTQRFHENVDAVDFEVEGNIRVDHFILPSLRISSKLRAEAGNEGVDWLLLWDHQRIDLPERFLPRKDFLEYHNDVVFIA